jgi:hypothetical protein
MRRRSTLFVAGVLVTASQALALDWSVQTVASSGGQHVSLALLPDGKPAIAFNGQTNGELKFTKWNGSSWDTTSLDTSAVVSTAMAVDSSGNRWVVYNRDAYPYTLTYIKYNGSSWGSPTAIEGSAHSASIALDSAGTPYVAFAKPGAEDLYYGKWNGSSWVTEAADNSAAETGYGPSIAVGTDGKPRISYFDRTNNKLMYAVKDVTWTTQQVVALPNGGGSVGYTSIALDSSSNPRIAYYDKGNSKLMYVAHNGTSWGTPQEVDASVGTLSGSKFESVSMKLDSNGNPWISYADNGDLALARWNGTTWVTETVDTGGASVDIGANSLALDSSGTPHIAYSDWTNNELQYASTPEPSTFLLFAMGALGLAVRRSRTRAHRS